MREMPVWQARVQGADDAIAVVRALAPGGAVDGMLVVGLDRSHRLCGVAVHPRHRALSFVKVWELRALVTELDAHALVIGVFPGGLGDVPSRHELAVFADLCTRARRAQVLLFDCVVARGRSWWSLRDLSAP